MNPLTTTKVGGQTAPPAPPAQLEPIDVNKDVPAAQGSKSWWQKLLFLGGKRKRTLKKNRKQKQKKSRRMKRKCSRRRRTSKK